MALADLITSAESGGNPYAKNNRSSAGGLGQFIDSTWLEMLSKNRPDLVQGKSREELLALKFDPQLSREMTDAYAAQNAGILQGADFPVTPGTQYLAHFAGPKGAIGVLSADPSTPIGSVLGPAAMAANPFLNGMTASDLISWADKKMGSNVSPSIPPAQAPIFPETSRGQPPLGISPESVAAAPMNILPVLRPQDDSQNTEQSGGPMGTLNAYLSQLMDEQDRMAQTMPLRPRIDLAKVYANLRAAPSYRNHSRG